jgi:hypothetical protein
MARVALESKKWWLNVFSLPTRSWHEDRSPLVRSLSDDEWRTLARAFYEMDVTSAAVAAIYANVSGGFKRGWAAPAEIEPEQQSADDFVQPVWQSGISACDDSGEVALGARVVGGRGTWRHPRT